MKSSTVTPTTLVAEARENYSYLAANMPDDAMKLARIGVSDRIHILYENESCCGVEKMPQIQRFGVSYYFYEKCNKFDICLKCLATYWYRWIR